MTVALTWVWVLFRDIWGQISIQNHSATSRWLAATAGSWQDSRRPYRNRLRQQGRAALPRCFLLSAMTTSSWNWLLWDFTYFLDRTHPKGAPTVFFFKSLDYSHPLHAAAWSWEGRRFVSLCREEPCIIPPLGEPRPACFNATHNQS